jgi:molybdopterin-guanine dinucleotide biosynthesis protein A
MVMGFVPRCEETCVDLAFQEGRDPFFNVNTPECLAEAA